METNLTGATGGYAGTRTITAMFDSAAEAERAIARLRSAGIPEHCIRHTAGARDSYDPAYRHDDHKGFWESLGDFFFPEEDRYTYAEGLSRGAHMVVVSGYDADLEYQIVDILDDEGTVDLDAREEEWRASGWTDYRESDYYRESGSPAGAGMSAAAAGADLNTRGTIYDDGMQGRTPQMAADMGRRDDAFGAHEGTGTDDTVKVVEERLNVGKREVSSGAVRIRSYVREEPVSAEVDLRSTRVFIERRPVDRAVTAGDMDFRDRTIEAREHVEEAVVAKEARVVEEIGLRQETDVHTETVSDTVRKTEVEIEDERTGETQRLSGDATRDRY
jgi:uncharacterized protein (TIGR02271 family)